MRKFLIQLSSVLFLVACSEETVDIAGQTLNYEELLAKTEEAEQELESINDELREKVNELSDVKNAIDENNERYEGLEVLASNKASILKEVEDGENKLESLQVEINKLEDELVIATEKTETAEASEETAKEEEAGAPAIEETVDKTDETLSQKNAVSMAKSYLDYSGFSKSGLIEQLMYEGFSNEDATHAVDEEGL